MTAFQQDRRTVVERDHSVGASIDLARMSECVGDAFGRQMNAVARPLVEANNRLRP